MIKIGTRVELSGMECPYQLRGKKGNVIESRHNGSTFLVRVEDFGLRWIKISCLREVTVK